MNQSKKGKKFSEIVAEIEASKKEIEFMPTGFYGIDEFLDGGFLRKELVVLGGGTGRGKSFVAETIFYNIAKGGFKCAYFSLEISNKMLVARLIGSLSNIKPTRIIAGMLTPEEYEAKMKAKAEINAYEDFMSFYDDLNILGEIESEIRKEGYEFIVVDFIQNVIVPKPDEYERLSFVAQQLQRLAKETNSCILVLSQLSNMMAREKREDIVEYRGSGTIATVCDLGFFIEREEQIGDENKFTIRLRKNRRGISGMAFDFLFQHPGGNITSL